MDGNVWYYEWDYERGKVTAFERRGRCNQCGACCAIGMGWKNRMDLVIDPEHPKNGHRTTDRNGIWCEVKDGDKRRFYTLPRLFSHIVDFDSPHSCSALASNLACTRQTIKSQFSADYPFHPSQTDSPLSQCSYRFVRMGQWNIAQINGVKE